MIFTSGAIFLFYIISMVLYVNSGQENLFYFIAVGALVSCLFVYAYWIKKMSGGAVDWRFNYPIKYFCGMSLYIFLFVIIQDSIPRYIEGYMEIVNDIAGASMVIVFFYLCWASSGCLVSREIGRPAKFHEIFGTFMLVVYLPLGMFFLKKRIFKAYNSQQSVSNN